MVSPELGVVDSLRQARRQLSGTDTTGLRLVMVSPSLSTTGRLTVLRWFLRKMVVFLTLQRERWRKMLVFDGLSR